MALLLGLVWLFVAFASIALGYGSNRWLLFAVALFAFWYALLWFRVVSRSRLLTWRDLLVPWRPE